MNNLRDLVNVLASTIALDQEIEDASHALCLELDMANCSGTHLPHCIAISHDSLMTSLSQCLDALGSTLDQYHYEDIDFEIRTIEHQLSEMHGVALTVTTPDNDCWF